MPVSFPDSSVYLSGSRLIDPNDDPSLEGSKEGDNFSSIIEVVSNTALNLNVASPISSIEVTEGTLPQNVQIATSATPDPDNSIGFLIDVSGTLTEMDNYVAEFESGTSYNVSNYAKKGSSALYNDDGEPIPRVFTFTVKVTNSDIVPASASKSFSINVVNNWDDDKSRLKNTDFTHD